MWVQIKKGYRVINKGSLKYWQIDSYPDHYYSTNSEDQWWEGPNQDKDKNISKDPRSQEDTHQPSKEDHKNTKSSQNPKI